ncbi:MAG: serine/threonine-protein phosphatase [Actinomycetota bacterium]|nr:serine/threonine-protein phosphatase [Actinomycetota bacterium]
MSLAGHPPAPLRRADGTVETVRRPGTILGVFGRPTLTNNRVSLHRGDALVLYTDGVTEARGDSGLYRDDPLRLLVAAGHDLSGRPRGSH